jgi:hypothetical protein
MRLLTYAVNNICGDQREESADGAVRDVVLLGDVRRFFFERSREGRGGRGGGRGGASLVAARAARALPPPSFWLLPVLLPTGAEARSDVRSSAGTCRGGGRGVLAALGEEERREE